MDNNEKTPLVTVGVITYNSAKTVLETLDSIYKQTYRNLELVISDDGSKDDTVDVCQKWMKEHSDRFMRTKMVTSPVNTGISGNCNRLMTEVKGKWYKGIAGDDVLQPNCITDFIAFVTKNPDAKWVVGKSISFHTRFTEENFLHREDRIYTKERLEIFNMDSNSQFKLMLKKNFVEAATQFIKPEMVSEVGGYDERYPMLDDWPLNIKLLKKGYKVYMLDKFVIGYRTSDSSVFNVRSNLYYMPFIDSLYQFKIKDVSPCLGTRYNAGVRTMYAFYKTLNRLGIRKRNLFSRGVHAVGYRIVSYIFGL